MKPIPISDGGPLSAASLRDFFAAHIMAGFLAAGATDGIEPKDEPEAALLRATIARASWKLADALIATRLE